MSRKRIDSEINELVEAKSLEKLDPKALLANVDQLKGKVAVVTGGASGFGKLYSEAAAAKGAKVVIADMNEEACKSLEKAIKTAGGDATGVKCDVTSWDQQVALFQRAVDTYGKVDVALCNAGVSELGAGEFESSTLEEPTLATLDVNVKGVIYTARIALHWMKKNPAKQKAIIITGSFASFYGSPLTNIYATSKHAVLGFTRSLSWVGKPHGIHVNLVAPYFAKTPILGPMESFLGPDHPLTPVEDVRDAMLALSVEDRRFGAVFLCDPHGVFASQPKLGPMNFPRL